MPYIVRLRDERRWYEGHELDGTVVMTAMRSAAHEFRTRALATAAALVVPQACNVQVVEEHD